MGTRNHGIVHSAITRQLIEKKLKKQISAASLGGAVGDLQELTNKVNAVQGSLGSIAATIAGIVQQISMFQSITDGLQTALDEVEAAVAGLIETALTKFSYLLEEDGDGIISYILDENDQDVWEVNNPFGDSDVIVQVVDESNDDEIVGVSTEISEEKITLYLAHCNVKGQYRVILMG